MSIRTIHFPARIESAQSLLTTGKMSKNVGSIDWNRSNMSALKTEKVKSWMHSWNLSKISQNWYWYWWWEKLEILMRIFKFSKFCCFCHSATYQNGTTITIRCRDLEQLDNHEKGNAIAFACERKKCSFSSTSSKMKDWLRGVKEATFDARCNF